MSYTEKVMDHFRNPRNVGEIPDADGVGEIGNPVCGDMMTFYIKVADNKLADVKFKTFGCGAAIAVSSMVSSMAIGMTLEEAKKISRQDVADQLGGLPPNKMHCSNLGADALHRAIADYECKKQAKTVDSSKEATTATCKTKSDDKCACPMCAHKLSEELHCEPCNKEFIPCPSCKKPIPKGVKECPFCKKAV
ncbi:MAG: Fe-S cluster assembly scaffold protein NifU [Planctomycetota bacterium]